MSALPFTSMLLRGDHLPLFEAYDHRGRWYSAYDHGAGTNLLVCISPVDPVLVLAALSAGAHVVALDEHLDIDHPHVTKLPPSTDYAAAVGGPGASVLCGPDLRVTAYGTDAVGKALIELASAPIDQGRLVCAGAPVLFVRDVFPPELCRELIAHADGEGFETSPTIHLPSDEVHRESPKARLDHHLKDERLVTLTTEFVASRVLAEIARAFDHRPQSFEAFKIVRYDAGAGWFRPHRDNTTPDAHHRRLALTINLNSGEYEGGDIRLPEFGPDRYRPERGAAMVFSGNLLHEVTDVMVGRRYALISFLW